MKAVVKFSLVFLTVILILVVSSSASSFATTNSIPPLSEPFALVLIGSGLIGLGSFFRKMKTDLASQN